MPSSPKPCLELSPEFNFFQFHLAQPTLQQRIYEAKSRNFEIGLAASFEVPIDSPVNRFHWRLERSKKFGAYILSTTKNFSEKRKSKKIGEV